MSNSLFDLENATAVVVGGTGVLGGAMADALAAGRQVLFLAPEIGLTPQLIERLRTRFDARIGVLHSQRSDGERADVWRAARAENLHFRKVL